LTTLGAWAHASRPVLIVSFVAIFVGLAILVRLIRFSGRLPSVDPLSFFVVLLKEKRLCH
jgi:hypothetical protein